MLEMLIINTLEIVISALLNLDLVSFGLIYNVLLYVLLPSNIAPSESFLDGVKLKIYFFPSFLL